MKRDWSRRAVVLFFVMLTLLGAAITGEYACSVDTLSEMEIAKRNAAEYARFIFGEESDFYRENFGDVQAISQNKERDHGVATHYPILPLVVLLEDDAPEAAMQAWYIWNFLMFMLGVWAVYGLARELFSMTRRAGCLMALLLYLTPRLFGESHYNNKDTVFLAVVLLTLWLGVRFIRRDRLRDAVWFSVVGAFAGNIKIIGFFVWGLMGVCYLVERIRSRSLKGKQWRNGLTAVAAFFGVFILITPSAWVEPVEHFLYTLQYSLNFSRWSAAVLFEGKPYHFFCGEKLPWYYLPKWIGMTMPVYILLLSAVGFFALLFGIFRFKKQTEEAKNRLVMLTAAALAGLVPLLVGMTSAQVLYNAWRHFYFVYASLLVLAVNGFVTLKALWQDRKVLLRVSGGALAAVMLFNGATIALNYPLEGCAFNPIGSAIAGEEYEGDYWVMSFREAVQGIVEHPDRNQDLPIVYSAASYLNPTIQRNLLYAPPDASAVYAENIHEANYYLLFPSQDVLLASMTRTAVEDMYGAMFGMDKEDLYADGAAYFNWNNDGEFRELFSLYSTGVKIVTVYERIVSAE